jgi:hypothetical protein
MTKVTTPVGTGGLLTNEMVLESQDDVNLISFVRVTGTITNIGATRITGSCTDGFIDGFRSHDDGPFSFNLAPGASLDFTTHQFNVPHNSDGRITATFTVHFGFTGVAALGNNQFLSQTMVMPRIPVPPGSPLNPRITAQTPTTDTVRWDPPTDDGGSAIIGYFLRRYVGDVNVAQGDNIQYPTTNSTHRNFTDLAPNQDYTYFVHAVNKSKVNGGVGVASHPVTLFTQSGVFVRHGGAWIKAQPFIRDGGKWVPMVVYIRQPGLDGQWLPTNS